MQRWYDLIDLEHNKKIKDLKSKMMVQGIKTFFTGK